MNGSGGGFGGGGGAYVGGGMIQHPGDRIGNAGDPGYVYNGVSFFLKKS